VERAAGNYFVVRCDDSDAARAARRSELDKNGSMADELPQWEETASFSMQAFPNPMVDRLQLVIDLPTDEKVSIVAFDMLGRLVMEREVSLQQGRHELYLQVDEWNSEARQFMLHLRSPSYGTKTLKLLRP
jgi:hypothetical protein